MNYNLYGDVKSNMGEYIGRSFNGSLEIFLTSTKKCFKFKPGCVQKSEEKDACILHGEGIDIEIPSQTSKDDMITLTSSDKEYPEVGWFSVSTCLSGAKGFIITEMGQISFILSEVHQQNVKTGLFFLGVYDADAIRTAQEEKKSFRELHLVPDFVAISDDNAIGYPEPVEEMIPMICAGEFNNQFENLINREKKMIEDEKYKEERERACADARKRYQEKSLLYRLLHKSPNKIPRDMPIEQIGALYKPRANK